MTVEKSIKRLAASMTDKISEISLFCSPQMSRYFTNINRTISGLAGKRFNVPTLQVVHSPMLDHTAFTDGGTITINTASDVLNFYPNINQRFLAIKGLDFHEMAHCLYLNFEASAEAMKKISAGQFYGEIPDGLTEEEEQNLEELKAAMNSKCAPVIAKLYHQFENIINDAHDEECLIDDFGKLVTGPLNTLRASLLADEECVEDVEEKIAKGEIHRLEAMQNLALIFCRFGDVFVAEEKTWKTSELCATLRKITAALEIARLTDSPEERYTKLNYVMISIWPYIKERLEAKDGGSPGGTGAGTMAGPGMPSASSGSCGGDESEDGGTAGGGSPGSDDGSDDGSGNGSSEQFDPESAASDVLSDILNALEEISKNLESAVPENRKTSETAKARAKAAGSAPGLTVSAGSDDPVSEEDLEAAAAAAIGMMKSEIAEELAASRLTAEETKEQREMARQAIGENILHKGRKVDYTRMGDVDSFDIEKYNEEMSDIRGFSKRLQRRMLEIMRETTLGMKNRHRAFGPMICAEDSYRPDQKFYANKKQPQDFPDMALAVLVDQSGSMWGSRIEQSRRAAMMLHDFAVGIGIPVCVSGHTTGRGSIIYDVYTDFDAYRKSDRYTLSRISAHNSNRDGAALEIACRHLQQRPEKMKLMIIICDGQPADDGYYGQEAMQDTKSVANKYRKNGMDVIAAAIGNDREAIRDIYGDGFLDISDLSKLPVTLTNIVKKRLLQQIA